MTADCYVFQFLWRSVDGKHLIRFQSEDSVFKFPWRSVDGALPPRSTESKHMHLYLFTVDTDGRVDRKLP